MEGRSQVDAILPPLFSIPFAPRTGDFSHEDSLVDRKAVQTEGDYSEESRSLKFLDWLFLNCRSASRQKKGMAKWIRWRESGFGEGSQVCSYFSHHGFNHDLNFSGKPLITGLVL